MHTARTSYPTPLSAPAHDAHASAREAARLLGISDRLVRRRIDRGLIAATRTPAGYRIPTKDLPLRHVTPADRPTRTRSPGSPSPSAG